VAVFRRAATEGILDAVRLGRDARDVIQLDAARGGSRRPEVLEISSMTISPSA
jgi:hypothetical protein